MSSFHRQKTDPTTTKSDPNITILLYIIIQKNHGSDQRLEQYRPAYTLVELGAVDLDMWHIIGMYHCLG